jgi:hypothetical protein
MKPTETDIVVEPSKANDGNWYWAFTVDGEVYADGEEATAADAKNKARLNREEWEHRNDDSDGSECEGIYLRRE